MAAILRAHGKWKQTKKFFELARKSFFKPMQLRAPPQSWVGDSPVKINKNTDRAEEKPAIKRKSLKH